MMLTLAPVQDDMFTPDVIADPYAYYGRLRDAIRSTGTKSTVMGSDAL